MSKTPNIWSEEGIYEPISVLDFDRNIDFERIDIDVKRFEVKKINLCLIMIF